MSDLMTPSIEDRLWHSMRRDLTAYLPEIAASTKLMCPTCGRLLPRDKFDLEHIIPRQTLSKDPETVRLNPATPTNLRARNLLLCKAPLRVKGATIYKNGCNSWKGRFFDGPITDLLTRKEPLSRTAFSTTHLIAGLVLGYLAMVEKWGYLIVLLPSGQLMRRQFFEPRRFLKDMPLRSQILLTGEALSDPQSPTWATPFGLSVQIDYCNVVARHFAINVPLSRDPTLPIARHLKFVPGKYAIKPNFDTVFD